MLWLPVRCAGLAWLVNVAQVRAIEPRPGGGARLHWTTGGVLDVDEAAYTLGVLLAVRSEG